MAKSADAFRTISEVAEWLEVPAHVLRFWESKFSQIKPVKRAGGRRYYRPADMLLLGGIKALLHGDGMTIKGVQKLLREQGVRHVSGLSQRLDEVTEGEVSGIALDVTPEPAEPAKVLNFGRGEDRPAPQPSQPAAETAADQNSGADISPADETEAPEPPAKQSAPPEPDVEAPAQDIAATSEEPTETAPDPSPEPGADSAPEPAAARVPKPLPLPELPADPVDAIAADSGVLSALAALPRPISPQTAARLTPLLARLTALGVTKSQDGQLRD
ncbi:MerR family transcriptional regulator [Roseovarius sp.]|uniref:MerR family transcriptional regulator n=1 Tax=Roseovarius sp. TaxID=1486281 RepID=UPI002603DABE|nr:MerR family transcriptional regulator [Roseovarius sp.]